MKQHCIKIPKKKGEYVRKMLLDLEILDNSLKIGMDGTFLYIPLSREPTTGELNNLPEKTELIDFYFEFQKKKLSLKTSWISVPHMKSSEILPFWKRTLIIRKLQESQTFSSRPNLI